MTNMTTVKIHHEQLLLKITQEWPIAQRLPPPRLSIMSI